MNCAISMQIINIRACIINNSFLFYGLTSPEITFLELSSVKNIPLGIVPSVPLRTAIMISGVQDELPVLFHQPTL